MISRRRFVAVSGLALFAVPRSVGAQRSDTAHRIGYLALNSLPNPFYEAFRQGLHELGYVDGRNIRIESRWAEGRTERLSDLAQELADTRVDVIVTAANAATLAAKQATRVIPIVMVNVWAPVELRIIENLARPGGNVTGLSYNASPTLGEKQLELLTTAVPNTKTVAMIYNAALPNPESFRPAIDAAARRIRVNLEIATVKKEVDFDTVFTGLKKRRVGAVLVLNDPLLFANRARIIALAATSKLPALYTDRVTVEDGGLMSYGPDSIYSYRRAASYVDRIFKGARPATLPVEQPTKFELVINLKTAKALGLTIPPSLLLRADEVIQ